MRINVQQLIIQMKNDTHPWIEPAVFEIKTYLQPSIQKAKVKNTINVYESTDAMLQKKKKSYFYFIQAQNAKGAPHV